MSSARRSCAPLLSERTCDVRSVSGAPISGRGIPGGSCVSACFPPCCTRILAASGGSSVRLQNPDVERDSTNGPAPRAAGQPATADETEEGRMGVAGGEVIVTALTHRGAVRPANEDAVVMGALTVAGANMTSPVRCVLPVGEPVILAVADGIGGQAAGEIASEHAVHRMAEV